MGSYNVKVYEYATGIQVRLYNQVLTYSEKVKKEPFLQSNEKVHARELSPERKKLVYKNPYHGRYRRFMKYLAQTHGNILLHLLLTGNYLIQVIMICFVIK